MWAGLLIVVLSAAGFAMAVAASGQREPVLVVARDVAAGHVFTADDLRSVKVAADGIDSVPSGEAARVVGRRAVLPLLAGVLLTRDALGAEAVYPPKGFSEASFPLAAGAAPGTLAAGERVAVLDSAPRSESGDAGKGGSERDMVSVVGTVTGVKEPDTAGGVRVVSVLVETVAGRRAAAIEEPRVLILPAQGREAP
ncbi:SAF domain-containing protein [Streptomyces sp. N35]|uniref:SAF domain-containing protein n=1 Tax=Streptomyces sp. N35 TaxID=2795730 RepID=UPI0018F2A1D1|nr:SAF domain-containing protein [Streptomyces sp. N35]